MEKYRYIKYNNGDNMIVTTINRLDNDIKDLLSKGITEFTVEKN